MTMSSSSGKESVDSMQDVTDLVVRVNESSIGGVELYVRVPVYQDSGELSQPEQPTTEELMVGYIRDVNDIRYMKSLAVPEGDRNHLRYEVVLADPVSAEHAQVLGVSMDQNFLVDCNELWDCAPARTLIMQYELYFFARYHKWSCKMLETASYRLLLSQLPTLENAENGISQLPDVAEWWWQHLAVRVELLRVVKSAGFRLIRAVQNYKQWQVHEKVRLLRTEVTFLRERPSFITWEPDPLAVGVSVVGQLLFPAGDSSFGIQHFVKGYLLACPGGHRRIFTDEHVDFAGFCRPGTVLAQLVHEFKLWHVFTLDISADRMAANFATEFVAELAVLQHKQQVLEKWSTMGRRLHRHVVFTQNADCLLLDKRGFLRPGYKLRLVDDDLLMVGTRCYKQHYKQKYRQVSDVLSFNLKHCDQLLIDCGQLENPVAEIAGKGPKLTAQDLVALVHAQVPGGDIADVDLDEVLKVLAESSAAISCLASEETEISAPKSSVASSVSLIDGQTARAKVVTEKPSQRTLHRSFAEATEMKVTRCVRHKEKVYYIFTRDDGQEQKLSGAGLATARLDVKAVVAEFEAWHLETFGITVEQSFDIADSNSSGEGSESDSSKALSAGLGEDMNLLLDPQIGDDDEDLLEDGDLEPESLLCESADERWAAAHKVMVARGLADFNVYRHPANWSDSVLYRVVESSDSDALKTLGLPKLPVPMAEVMGTYCVVMEPYFQDDDVMLNMEPDERMDSYFAVVCQITGESSMSTDDVPIVNCTSVFQEGVVLEVELDLLVAHMKQLETLLCDNLPSDNVAVRVLNPDPYKVFEGKNLRKMPKEKYLTQRGGNATVADHDSELLAAMNSFGAGKDVLLEAEAREMAEESDEDPIWEKAAKKKKKPTGVVGGTRTHAPAQVRKKKPTAMFAEESDEEVIYTPRKPKKKILQKPAVMEARPRRLQSDSDDENGNQHSAVEAYMDSMKPSDPRKPLRRDAVEAGYRRCLLFTCGKFLKPGDTKCGCGCMANDYCACEGCGAAYDPNDVVACGRCNRVLPHDAKAYQAMMQAEMQTEKLAESLSADKKSGSDYSKSKKAEHQIMQDKVMHLFVKGAGATKPRVWSGMRGTNQALLTLERMSSKCSRDIAAESPFVVGTNNVVTYNLLANLAGQKYGMLGQGASLWEFVPRQGEWNSAWYFDDAKDKCEMLTVAQQAKLRAATLDEDIFLKTVDNMGKTMAQVSGRCYRDQLHCMAECLVKYRNSFLAQVRKKKAPFSMMLDIMDALHQQRSDYLLSAAELSGQNGFDLADAVQMLHAEFPLVRITKGMTITDVPKVKIVELCGYHRNELTAANFPERINTCGCKFNRYVTAMLEAVQEGSSVAAYVFPQGSKGETPKAAKAGDAGADLAGNATPKSQAGAGGRKVREDKKKKKGDMQKTKAGKTIPWKDANLNGPPAPLAKPSAVGTATGGKAAIRGDIPADKYEHARVDSKTFGNKWALMAYTQTGEMCRKLGQPLVCTRTLSAMGKGCEQAGCQFPHEYDKSIITLEEIQKYPVQEAFLVGRWNGLAGLPNKTRFSADAANFEKLKKTLRRFCVEKLKDHAELEAETESDEETVDGVGIQSAAAPIAAGAAAARTGTPEGRSDLRTGRRGEDATVAQLNRVIFNHKVPSLSEADTAVTIASSALATLPATMGTVPIESGFTMTVNCPATSVSLGHSYEFEVLDCGEEIGDERKRCEIVSGAAVCRHPGGPAAMQAGYRDDSRYYLDVGKEHAADAHSRRHKMPHRVYDQAVGDVGLLQKDKGLMDLESEAVTKALATSSEIAPFVGAVLAQPQAVNQAEVKMFLNEQGTLSWHVGISSECLDPDDPTKLKGDVPVVWRFYDNHHAFAARLVRTTINGLTTDYEEDMVGVDRSTWQGLRLGDLQSITEELNCLLQCVTLLARRFSKQFPVKRC